MRVLVLNGSPHAHGHTSALVEAFAQGAREAGHEVEILQVGRMDIAGCLGCDACRRNGGTCVQHDDEQRVYDALESADALVIASPIYHFMLSAQMEAAIQRTHAIGVPARPAKTALILNSGSDGVYDLAIGQWRRVFVDWMGMQDGGVLTAHGSQSGEEPKLAEARELGRNI